MYFSLTSHCFQALRDSPCLPVIFPQPSPPTRPALPTPMRTYTSSSLARSTFRNANVSFCGSMVVLAAPASTERELLRVW